VCREGEGKKGTEHDKNKWKNREKKRVRVMYLFREAKHTNDRSRVNILD
jgi:hypothetical protein